MKILIIGSDYNWSIERIYKRELLKLGHEVTHVPVQNWHYDFYYKSTMHKALVRLGLTRLQTNIQKRLLAKINDEYFDLILGNNNAIIFNSKYYRMVLFLGLFLVFLTVALNMLFIPGYGILGSAFATLLSITLYSLAKLLFVVKRMRLFPFTVQTLYSMAITFVLFLVFYFWQFPFYPLIGIALKSIFVTIAYVYFNYRFVISQQINDVIDGILKKIKILKLK
mgnify:CR=1 FL=1